MPEPPRRPGVGFREDLAALTRRQHKRGEFVSGGKSLTVPALNGARVENMTDSVADLHQQEEREGRRDDLDNRLVARRGIYRIFFAPREKESVEAVAAEFGMPASEWVVGLGRGAFEPPFHRMQLQVEDDATRTANIRISVWDDEYDDIVTRLRMAQPLLAAGASAVTWYDYFRMTALGLLIAPVVRGEFRNKIFLPSEIPTARAVQNLVLAARSSRPRPRIYPDLELAQRKFLQRLWWSGWQGTEQEFKGFLDLVQRIWDGKREGPIPSSLWADSISAIEELGREGL
jgi:hypothetical protein